MSDIVIDLKRLTRYFGSKPVVRDLDFRVPGGKVTALLGLNGAGKTNRDLGVGVAGPKPAG